MSRETPASPDGQTRVVAPPGKAAPLAPQIPDHELLRRIGKGSYGEVWLARNALGAYRAVKVVYRASFEHDRPYEREFEGIKRYEPVSREHDSQVDILHVGRDDRAGYFFYVMELADDAGTRPAISNRPPVISDQKDEPGEAASVGDSEFRIPHSALVPESYQPRTLRSDLAVRGRLPARECLEIGLSLTRALVNLHGHGLIHRDIKPANIVFVHGVPKLADIGLVTETGDEKSFVGTEGYFPPEGPGAPAGDLYSLGKVLYEMATGRDRMDFPELPTNLDAFPDKEGLLALNRVILKACAQDVAERYASAVELHLDLQRLRDGLLPLEKSKSGDLVEAILKAHDKNRPAAYKALSDMVLCLIFGWSIVQTLIWQGVIGSGRKPTPTPPQLKLEASAAPAPLTLPANLAALPAGNALQVAYTGTPPAAPAQAERPRLQFEITARRKDAGDFTLLNDGDALASEADHYLLVARPLTAGWLYVFQVDSSGKVDWLYPKNASAFSSGANPVSASQVIQLPAADGGALYLDRTTGIEHVYAVFSAARWTELEDALTRPAPADTATRSAELAGLVQTPNGLRTRGVGGIAPSDTANAAADALALERVHQGKSYKLPLANQVLQSSGTFLVVERWFKHVNAE